MIDGILDTNVVIDLLREVSTTIEWYASLDQQQMALVPIVWMEVVQGSLNKTDQTRTIRFLSRFQVVHPNSDDNVWAMQQFSSFYLSHGIQYQDAMIAFVAVRLNVPLYTFNLKHFAPLPGVIVRRPY